MLNETAKIPFSPAGAPAGSVNATVPGVTIGAGARMRIADFRGVPIHLFGELQETWWNSIKQNNGAFQYTYRNRADTRISAGIVLEIPHWPATRATGVPVSTLATLTPTACARLTGTALPR